MCHRRQVLFDHKRQQTNKLQRESRQAATIIYFTKAQEDSIKDDTTGELKYMKLTSRVARTGKLGPFPRTLSKENAADQPPASPGTLAATPPP